MTISMIIPTRDRPGVLRDTLDRLGRLDTDSIGDCELVVVDNASAERVVLAGELPNGIAIRSVRLEENLHTGARNVAAQHASGEWLLMLDDDSSVLPCAIADVLGRLPGEVAAVGGEILLPSGQHESGGLPEVIVGCGCAIRRKVFLDVGAYDAGFGYYVEEYDLCAKLIASGHSVIQTQSLRFEHRKSSSGRDFNQIMFRLVRNNAWVLQRYSPGDVLEDSMNAMLKRYESIAIKEDAMVGYRAGLEALEHTIDQQQRSPLSTELWDRFTGRAAVRDHLSELSSIRDERVRLVGAPNAKGRDIVEEELKRLGCELTHSPDAVPVVSSISPGPMLDTLVANPNVITPWDFSHAGAITR